MNVTDEMIVMTPPGHRFGLLCASYFKHALQAESDPQERLKMLEALEAIAVHGMPLAAARAIEPMPPVGVEILHTAFQLDLDRDGMKRCDASFKILTGGDVFQKLIAICPSIGKSIAIYYGRRGLHSINPKNRQENSNERHQRPSRRPRS
jgi:hypothetical protein